MAGERKTDKTVALLQLLAGLGNGGGSDPGNPGLHIVTVKTANPVTLQIEGVLHALDPEIFVIPVAFQPLQEGQTFFGLPIVGDTEAPRWGLIQRIT